MPHQINDRYKGKYRSVSNRLKGWDYSQNAHYFITLVTQHRECNLGQVIQEEMILSDFGKIVNTEWLKSFELRNELFLDEYVIMPNHMHAIVRLQKFEKEIGIADFAGSHGRATLQPCVPAEIPNHRPSDSTPSPLLYRKPKSISSFMAGFKSAVNSKIDDHIDKFQLPIPKYNRYNHFFQPNYHDRIIRNLLSYLRIKQYIRNNPKNWKADALNIL